MAVGTHSFVSTPTGSTAGTGLTLSVTVRWNTTQLSKWNAYWSVTTRGTGYKAGETLTIARPSSGLPSSSVFPNGATFVIAGVELPSGETQEATAANPDVLTGNVNGYDAVADYVQFPDMEQKSHQEGPEHEIVYVNEMVDPSNDKARYPNLALGGIRINSAKEWTNFTQLSAYFKKGIKIDDLINGGAKKASNNFAEIAYALLTDSTLGAGEIVGVNAVGDMSDAAKFCKANGFTWDGVISSKINLRDFLYEHGTYNLLDFTVIGGKFNLVPSVPFASDTYEIAHRKAPKVKALFTDGNINDLKVSFLSPEERQLFTASVLYREEKANGFPETKNLIIRLIDEQGGSRSDPIEAYDLSGFCTTRDSALIFAKYILKLRKEIDHGVSFKTSPQYCVNLSPGDYFKLVSESTHVQRYDNGVITEEGEVISNDPITDTNADIYYWRPGTEEVLEASGVNFVTGANLPSNVLFTLKNSVTSNRIYKLETISYAEDGLLEIAGSHAPVTSSGSLAILDGWDGAPPFYHFKEVT